MKQPHEMLTNLFDEALKEAEETYGPEAKHPMAALLLAVVLVKAAYREPGAPDTDRVILYGIRAARGLVKQRRKTEEGFRVKYYLDVLSVLEKWVNKGRIP